jgi:predicted helicase
MAPTTKNQVALSLDLIESRVDRLRSQLGCLGQERDTQGSDFWYLRLGTDELEIPNTRPIAIGFDDRLNDLTEAEIKDFSTAKDSEIYRHYLDRVSTEQPVMYLLYPSSEESGRVAFILPQEGGLKQRDIKVFELGSRELATRLERFKIVPVAQNILCSVPLVERVFYDPIETAKELAQQLAIVAKRIEQIIPKVYRQEQKDGYLNKLLASFKDKLLPFLELEAKTDKDYSFADIYAQTVAYSLFTARVFSHLKWQKELQVDPTVKQPLFDREFAWTHLPETNPFLRQLFKDISERHDLGDGLITEIAHIFGILRAAKMEAILSDFSQTGNRDDIIIHFYEPFLDAYNPSLKEKRGVYYTPESVVSYMIRSVDILLKDKFHKPLGLADPDVMILDPAAGTGTFLLWIFQLVERRFKGTDGDVESHRLIKERFGDMSWSQYARDHLLPRIFGFELLMAPYAIAHLKLSLFLQESGYEFDEDQRLGIYLTNTLEDSTRKADILFEQYISEESDRATAIKTDEKVMVVVGNPPYSIQSQNLGDNAKKWIEGYRFVDGTKIKEKGALQFEKNLQDDCNKFFGFAEWKINKTGYGILAFVSNHTYLHSSSLRGMRQSLSKTFDNIFVIDLHGNSRRKEKCPDGSKDENVFQIQQGVSIGLFTQKPDGEKESCGSMVKHTSLYGVENYKNTWLSKNCINTTEWNNITPLSPNYLLIPQNANLLNEYEQGYKITDIFPVNSAGVISARDNMVVDFQEQPILERVQIFKDSPSSDEALCQELHISNKKGWDIQRSRSNIKKEVDLKQFIKSITYRPFDERLIFYHDSLVWTTAKKIMQHMLLGNNLGLISAKSNKSDRSDHFFCSNNIIETKCGESTTQSCFFPLYIYPTSSVEIKMGVVRRPNISLEFYEKLQNVLGYKPSPEDIFYYIYAIFHSPGYRSRYSKLINTDFPRVPITHNVNLFRQLGKLGEELVNLHLMKSSELSKLKSSFVDNGGGGVVDIIKYENNKILINKQKDGFVDVPEEVWNFHIGGYPVCKKWLNYRKGYTLSSDDTSHYQKTIVALRKTIDLMAKIDEAIPNWPLDAEYN